MTKSIKSTKIVNKALFASKIDTMIENGRKEITTKKQLEKYPIGSLISYLRNDNIYKPGGFIIEFAPEYFIYILHDFSTKYRARYHNIDKMWVGSVYKTKNDFVSIVPIKHQKTNFPVIVNNVTIYYAKNTFDVKRFINTEKYKKIIQWREYFEL
jgi:hypothetical protein